MLSIVWSWIVSFVEKLLKEKNYKAIIMVLLVIFLGNTVVLNVKVSQLSNNSDSLKSEIIKQNTISEKRIYTYINQLNYDAIELFQAYTRNNAEDLKTIIDKTAVTADNSYLLKKLIEKSNTEIIQEIKKTQFKNRYLHDTLLIEKVTSSDSIQKPALYARK